VEAAEEQRRGGVPTAVMGSGGRKWSDELLKLGREGKEVRRYPIEEEEGANGFSPTMLDGGAAQPEYRREDGDSGHHGAEKWTRVKWRPLGELLAREERAGEKIGRRRRPTFYSRAAAKE
jgi:hypothetical protein